MKLRNGMAALLVSVALFGVSACENSKDKAVRHLASALQLAEAGDGDRALVEFRNVFQLDAQNLEAHRAFAAFLARRGDLAGAFAQYRTVIDASPADQEALRGAATTAAQMNNWPDAATQASALLALRPGDGEMTAIQTAAAYAEAAAKGDAAGRAKAAEAARAQLAARPDDLYLHRVLIDNLTQDGDTDGALAALAAAQKLFPDEPGLYGLRVSLLAAKDDKPGVEATLLEMDAKFPDPAIGQALMRWYVGTGQVDKAEAWLRSRTEAPGEAGLRARMQMVLFLRQFRGPEAALAEIDAALKLVPDQPSGTPAPAAEAGTGAGASAGAGAGASTGGPVVTATGLRVLRASILYDTGQADPAIGAMKEILAKALPGDETRVVKVTLARMLLTSGDRVQSRALVEEVLAEDKGNVEALKLKSGWAIDEDRTDDAIAMLRSALEAAPRDAQTMTLLAMAYGRAGNRELQADMLAQAVDASGKAPEESLRYANLLAADQKYLPAESLLVEALRLAPDNLDLLGALGDLYLRMKDWPRAEGVAVRLEDLGGEPALAIARRLRPAILAGRNDVGAAVDYLKGLAESSGDLRDQMALISAYLAQGKASEARTLAEGLLAKAPGSTDARLVLASVKGATGDGAGAMEDYRAILAQTPKEARAWIALVRQSVQTKGQPSAEPVIDEALAQLPDQPDLLLMKASVLELRQDIDGAIAIYDRLYAINSDNLIVANNLASLIATWKTDPPSLDRAWAVARRLNGTTVAPFADTYGWLAHLRGQSAEALPYLDLAAKGLDGDPMVHFHYAEVLKAQGKAEEARAQYARVLDLVPPDDSRAFVATARKEAKP